MKSEGKMTAPNLDALYKGLASHLTKPMKKGRDL
jgi:hypothetical protein